MNSRSWRAIALSALAVSVCAADPARIATFEKLFRPFETDQVALSANGRYVAYTRREQNNLILVIRDFMANTVRRLPIGVDEVTMFDGVSEPTPAKLRFLGWVGDDWLVFTLKDQDVWSIRADLSAKHSLADFHTFDEQAPEPQESTPDPGDFSRPPKLAQSALVTLTNPFPIDVVGVSPVDHCIFLRSLVRVGLRVPPRSRVVRVDVTTGQAKEISELERTSTMTYDREGYPRLYRGSGAYVYGDRKGNWGPIDIFEPGRANNAITAQSGGERLYVQPLGFDYDPDVLYCLGRIQAGLEVVAIDVRTWQQTPFHFQIRDTKSPGGATPMFDPWKRRLVGVRLSAPESAGQWIDPDIAAVQKALNETTSQLSCRILDWSAKRDVFLTLEEGRSEPGVYSLYRASDHTMAEFLDIAPWLDAKAKNEVKTFDVERPGRGTLIGCLTMPRRSLLKRPPVVVLCSTRSVSRLQPKFDAEAQALATMGFIVLQVELRASDEYEAIDQILTALSNALPAEADRRLVAIMGRSYGGFLALRAVQLFPDRFRCAVAIDTPMDLTSVSTPPSPRPMSTAPSRTQVSGETRFYLQPSTFTGRAPRAAFTAAKMDFGAWLDKASAADLQKSSPASHPELFKNPIMVIERDRNVAFDGEPLAKAAKKYNADSIYLRLSPNDSAALPHAQAVLFDHINDFLNTNIYDYAVKIGALKTIDQP